LYQKYKKTGGKICRNQNVAERANGISSVTENGSVRMKKRTDMESKRLMMKSAIHMRVVNLQKKEAEKSASFFFQCKLKNSYISANNPQPLVNTKAKGILYVLQKHTLYSKHTFRYERNNVCF